MVEYAKKIMFLKISQYFISYYYSDFKNIILNSIHLLIFAILWYTKWLFDNEIKIGNTNFDRFITACVKIKIPLNLFLLN